MGTCCIAKPAGVSNGLRACLLQVLQATATAKDFSAGEDQRCALGSALRIAKWAFGFAPTGAGHGLGTHALAIVQADPPMPGRRRGPAAGAKQCQRRQKSFPMPLHDAHFSPVPKPSRRAQSRWHRQCVPSDRPRAANVHQSVRQTAWRPRARGQRARWAHPAWQTAPVHTRWG